MKARQHVLKHRRATPLVLQAEIAECGLACLVMVAQRHGAKLDLATARDLAPVSARGMTLADLKRTANALGLVSRALRVELDVLARLSLPCVLHWNFDHFVVLDNVTPHGADILDPGSGRRHVTTTELSRYFTGIALELAPSPALQHHVLRPLSLQVFADSLRSSRGALKQLLGLTLILQGLVLLGPVQLQWLVDDVARTRDSGWIDALALGFVLLTLLHTIVAALRGWLISALGASMRLYLFSHLFARLVRLPMAWFLRRRLANVLSRLGSVEVVQRTLATGFIETLVDASMVLLSLTMMFLFGAWLALVPAAVAVLSALLRVTTDRLLRQTSDETLERGASRASHVMETVRGIQTIKLHGQEQARAATACRLAVDEANSALRHDRLQLLSQVVNGLLFGLENVVTLSLAAHQLLAGTDAAHPLTLGTIFAFLAYKMQFMVRFGSVAEKLVELRMLSVHIRRIADINDTPEETGALPLEHNTLSDSGEIELRGLRYRHANSDPLLLVDIALHVRDGEFVAIVGASGCGKTTLLKLILGILQPESGTICVAGQELGRCDQARHRALFGSVMQDDMLFGGSIAQNITCFDPRPDAAHVEQSARLACLHDDIMSMPMGYLTLVGDTGNLLSGGQRQRLLLARALYRRPRILLLDEATSHLDINTELNVTKALRDLGMTRIVVAHRPQTIENADRVFALIGGRLVARTKCLTVV